MLVFVGTLLIVFRLGSKARNDCKYIGQPSRFIHFSVGAAVVLFAVDVVVDPTILDAEKNDFACSIKAGLSPVLMLITMNIIVSMRTRDIHLNKSHN